MKILLLHRPGLLACLFIVSAISTPFAGAAERPALSLWLDNILRQHPQLQAARAGVDAARAARRAAEQPLYNPELELEVERSDIRTNTAGISQTIDWGDKRSARTNMANHALILAKATFQQQRQNIATSLLNALALYQSSLDIKQISDKRYQLMSRFTELAEKRRKAGDLSQIELDLARLATAEANFQRANAEADRIEAERELVAHSGVVIGQLPDFPTLPESRDFPATDREQLVDSLPAMRIARSQMDVSRAEVQLRQREQRPDPSFGLRAGKEGKESLAGLSLSIPLHVRNNFQAEVDIANAQLIQRQREAIDVRRQLAAKLDSSVLSYQINRNAWIAWQKTGKQSLQQQTQLLDRLWRTGELSTTDYLVQLKQSLDTEAGAIEQRRRMWQTWIDLLATSGDIESWLTANGELK